MSELEVYQNLENAMIIENRKKIETLHVTALGVSAGQGHKKSIKKIKELSDAESKKQRQKELGSTVSMPLFEKVDDSWQIKT